MNGIVNRELTDKVLNVAFTVHRGLGSGLLEAVYEEAFCVELTYRGIAFERQRRYPVFYRGKPVGDYFADLVVEDSVLLELKSVRRFSEVMEAQLINYLHLSGIQVGYLLNFHGQRLDWRRFVCSTG